MADAQGSGGYSHMKKMRMLVIFLRNVNCKFWSRDGKPTLFFTHTTIYLFIYYFPTIKITQALHYTKMWRGDLRKPQGLYEEAPSLQ